jgi:hypothetical protein
MGQQRLVGRGLLIIEASRSHFLDTPHSVGLLWTIDQPAQRLPDNTQHSQEKIVASAGFESSFPASERPQTHALYRAATGMGTDAI